MTIRSMTGFGSAQASSQGWSMKVSCRSVNHRGLDVRVWAPRDWEWIEPYVLGAVRAIAQRGRVEVRVDVESDAAGSGSQFVDREVFVAVAQELEAARTAAGISEGATVSDVLLFEAARPQGIDSALPDDFADFQAAIGAALSQLVQAREEEGDRLVDTLRGLLDDLEARLKSIDSRSGDVVDEYRTRLEARMREALERFGIDEIDERSLLHEVALYADRADVSEEVQRATSHIAKLRELLEAAPEDPVGKQIDFYLQELIRETNTTGSKSSSIEITNDVIAMKTAIEKMREQAANIE